MRDSSHVLHVPIVGQRTGSECGNTVITAVVQYLGKRYSSADMKKACGTTGDGTDHARMIECARKTGAQVFEKAAGEIDELERFIRHGLPVIVGWWSMDEDSKHHDPDWPLWKKKENDRGHFSVLRGFTETHLLLMDPQAGDDDRTVGYCTMRDKKFWTVWYDTDTDAYALVKRWYIVLSYEGMPPFAHKLGGKLHEPLPAIAVGSGDDD